MAGIRTKGKATGLRFYEPERYAGEHEVDFEQAKRLFGFLVKRGFDIGESSALALYAVLQMVNFGTDGKFVVILADGAKKYKRTRRVGPRPGGPGGGAGGDAREREVEAGEVRQRRLDAHGIRAQRRGGEAHREHAGAPRRLREGGRAGRRREAHHRPGGPDGTDGGSRRRAGAEGGEKRVLLVCMSGNTSLRAAQVLESKGIKSQSLSGGITKLAQASHKPLPTLIKPAK